MVKSDGNMTKSAGNQKKRMQTIAIYRLPAFTNSLIVFSLLKLFDLLSTEPIYLSKQYSRAVGSKFLLTGR